MPEDAENTCQKNLDLPFYPLCGTSPGTPLKEWNFPQLPTDISSKKATPKNSHAEFKGGNLIENPPWRLSQAEGISNLLHKIPMLFNDVKTFVLDPANAEFTKGFNQYYHEIYLTECNRGEKTGTQTLQDTRLALTSDTPERNYKKTRNLSKAFHYLFGESPVVQKLNHVFDEQLARRLNQMIGDGLFVCGEYRKKDAKPAGYDYYYLSPDRIEVELASLFRRVREMQVTQETCYQAATYFLVEFLSIHPFSNGNGRTARLLLSALLIRYTVVPVALFTSHMEAGKSNEVYLNCIHEAHRYGNSGLLTSYLIYCTFRSLETCKIGLEI